MRFSGLGVYCRSATETDDEFSGIMFLIEIRASASLTARPPGNMRKRGIIPTIIYHQDLFSLIDTGRCKTSCSTIYLFFKQYRRSKMYFWFSIKSIKRTFMFLPQLSLTKLEQSIIRIFSQNVANNHLLNVIIFIHLPVYCCTVKSLLWQKLKSVGLMLLNSWSYYFIISKDIKEQNYFFGLYFFCLLFIPLFFITPIFLLWPSLFNSFFHSSLFFCFSWCLFLYIFQSRIVFFANHLILLTFP